jgi:hypothetical protein
VITGIDRAPDPGSSKTLSSRKEKAWGNSTMVRVYVFLKARKVLFCEPLYGGKNDPCVQVRSKKARQTAEAITVRIKVKKSFMLFIGGNVDKAVATK